MFLFDIALIFTFQNYFYILIKILWILKFSYILLFKIQLKIKYAKKNYKADLIKIQF
jgi:hypothetical protein